MRLRNRRTIKDLKESILKNEREWEKREIINNRRKQIIENNNMSNTITYGMTEVINDYDSKNMKDKKFYEICKLITDDDIDKCLLGIYSLYKQLNDSPTDKNLRIKIYKNNKIHLKIENVMKNRPDFSIIILKYITSYMSIGILIDAYIEIEKLFLVHFYRLMKEYDYYYIIYSMNIIGKIIKYTFDNNKLINKKDNEYYINMIDNILDVREDIDDKIDHIVSIKYYVYNIILEISNEDIWMRYTIVWIQYTCKILNVGSIIHKKSHRYEEWIRCNNKIQQSIVERYSREIIDICTNNNTCIFYIMYLLQYHTNTLMNMNNIRNIVHEELISIPHASM